MSNSFGKNYSFTIFGQSHAPAIGVCIEGLPSGFEPDMDALSAFMARRAPGGRYATSRKEPDVPEFISGLVNGKTCGAPLTAIIKNTNTRSSDYEYMRHIPRPGHADFTAMAKYGESRDYSGGGQFSGRLTAPLCIAGALAMQAMVKYGVRISSSIVSIGGERDEEKMFGLIDKVRAEGDSVGGVIECRIEGLRPGVGEPMFDGIENHIAQAVFAIPAVKGIEFGAGFAAADMKGSSCNDPFVIDENGDIKTEGNNHGGILGGISSGMPIVFRVAIKPTPSIAKAQKSVDMETMKETELNIRGRHDPCIVPRALPCVEAAAAVAIYDLILEAERY